MITGYSGLAKIVTHKNLMSNDQAEKNSLKKKVTIQSDQLFQGSREIIIEHSAHEYRLMITKAGKLILNK